MPATDIGFPSSPSPFTLDKSALVPTQTHLSRNPVSKSSWNISPESHLHQARRTSLRSYHLIFLVLWPCLRLQRSGCICRIMVVTRSIVTTAVQRTVPDHVGRPHVNAVLPSTPLFSCVAIAEWSFLPRRGIVSSRIFAKSCETTAKGSMCLLARPTGLPPILPPIRKGGGSVFDWRGL